MVTIPILLILVGERIPEWMCVCAVLDVLLFTMECVWVWMSSEQLFCIMQIQLAAFAAQHRGTRGNPG